MKTKETPWAKIYNDITRDPRVSDSAHRVYCALKSIQGNAGSCRAKHEFIQSRTPYKDKRCKTVRRGIDILEDAGWILVKRNAGQPNEYVVLDACNAPAPRQENGPEQGPVVAQTRAVGGPEQGQVVAQTRAVGGPEQGQVVAQTRATYKEPLKEPDIKNLDKAHSERVRAGIPEPVSEFFSAGDLGSVRAASERAAEECGFPVRLWDDLVEVRALDALARPPYGLDLAGICRVITSCAHGNRNGGPWARRRTRYYPSPSQLLLTNTSNKPRVETVMDYEGAMVAGPDGNDHDDLYLTKS